MKDEVFRDNLKSHTDDGSVRQRVCDGRGCCGGDPVRQIRGGRELPGRVLAAAGAPAVAYRNFLCVCAGDRRHRRQTPRWIRTTRSSVWTGFVRAVTGGETADPAFRKAHDLRRSLAETRVTHRHCVDLIRAFKQDATKLRYDDWDDLIGYCASLRLRWAATSSTCMARRPRRTPLPMPFAMRCRSSTTCRTAGRTTARSIACTCRRAGWRRRVSVSRCSAATAPRPRCGGAGPLSRRGRRLAGPRRSPAGRASRHSFRHGSGHDRRHREEARPRAPPAGPAGGTGGADEGGARGLLCPRNRPGSAPKDPSAPPSDRGASLAHRFGAREVRCMITGRFEDSRTGLAGLAAAPTSSAASEIELRGPPVASRGEEGFGFEEAVSPARPHHTGGERPSRAARGARRRGSGRVSPTLPSVAARTDSNPGEVDPVVHVSRVVARSGTSFLWGMRVLPRSGAGPCTRSTPSAARSTTSSTSRGRPSTRGGRSPLGGKRSTGSTRDARNGRRRGRSCNRCAASICRERSFSP